MHDIVLVGTMVKKNLAKLVLCAAAAGLLLSGCARIPEKLISPTLKIEPFVENNAPAYKFMLSSGIQNENSDTVFLNMKGVIFFNGPGKSDDRIFSVPFELPVVLPFDTGIIEIEKTYPEAEIIPLIRFLGSDKDKLAADRSLERSFGDDKTIGFELTGYEKRDILEVLKDKVDEKN
ncbi:MAG: hypothetical protein JXA07_14505 [Spirochaetes bacterium]|nr:hypothetical protein [Spirochaetota bacterium]